MSTGSFVQCPAGMQQLELFLCYCTLNKWLCGMRHLRLYCGKPGDEAVRKPGLTVQLWSVGTQMGTCGVTGTTAVKGLHSQQLQSLALGVFAESRESYEAEIPGRCKREIFIAKTRPFKAVRPLSVAFHLGTTNIIQPTTINHDVNT